jgi:hypothetical protein
MAEYVCDRCGEVNPVGTVFCVNCHAFLAWDQVDHEDRLKGEGVGVGPSGEPGPVSEQNVETRVMPQIRVPATAPKAERDKAASPRPGAPADSTEGLFRISAERRDVTVPPTAERRPLARVLLTLFGGLAMIIGAFLPWRAVSELRGVDLDADAFMQVFGVGLNPAGFERLISVGLAILALAALMIFGLTGRSGRLSRLSVLLGAALVVGTFVALAITGRDVRPDTGAILVLTGCIAGYMGGLLARR